MSITLDIQDTGTRITGWLHAFDIAKKSGLGATHLELKFSGDKKYSVRNTSYTFDLGTDYGTLEIIAPEKGRFGVAWHAAHGGASLFDGELDRSGDSQQH